MAIRSKLLYNLDLIAILSFDFPDFLQLIGWSYFMYYLSFNCSLIDFSTISLSYSYMNYDNYGKKYTRRLSNHGFKEAHNLIKKTGMFMKRDTTTGRFYGKNTPYKGVRKEKNLSQISIRQKIIF